VKFQHGFVKSIIDDRVRQLLFSYNSIPLIYYLISPCKLTVSITIRTIRTQLQYAYTQGYNFQDDITISFALINADLHDNLSAEMNTYNKPPFACSISLESNSTSPAAAHKLSASSAYCKFASRGGVLFGPPRQLGLYSYVSLRASSCRAYCHI